jgi:DME family drug/metabolite transporter
VLAAGVAAALYQAAFFSAVSSTGVAVGTLVVLGSGDNKRRVHQVRIVQPAAQMSGSSAFGAIGHAARKVEGLVVRLDRGVRISLDAWRKPPQNCQVFRCLWP